LSTFSIERYLPVLMARQLGAGNGSSAVDVFPKAISLSLVSVFCCFGWGFLIGGHALQVRLVMASSLIWDMSYRYISYFGFFSPLGCYFNH